MSGKLFEVDEGIEIPFHLGEIDRVEVDEVVEDHLLYLGDEALEKVDRAGRADDLQRLSDTELREGVVDVETYSWWTAVWNASLARY